jgi:predicted phosphatase
MGSHFGTTLSGKQGRIIIKTSDADVIYFDKQMTNTSELWVQMGNVSSVKDGRRVLPGAHAHTNLLPFPKKEEVVLHPERACAPGRTL